LLLKYEDLTNQSVAATQRIADFLKLEQQEEFTNDFNRYHRIFPHFFRRGSNPDNIAELKGDTAELFWTMHGHLMKGLQYVKSIPEIASTPRSLLIRRRDRAIEVENRLGAERNAVDMDRRAKDGVIATLSKERAALAADHKARGIAIETLTNNLQAVEADRQAKDAVIARLSGELEAIEADRRAKDTVIARLSGELEAIEADRRAKDAAIARLTGELKAVEADRAVKNEIIAGLNRQLGAVKVGRHAVFVGYTSANVLDGLRKQEDYN